MAHAWSRRVLAVATHLPRTHPAQSDGALPADRCRRGMVPTAADPSHDYLHGLLWLAGPWNDWWAAVSSVLSHGARPVSDGGKDNQRRQLEHRSERWARYARVFSQSLL